MEPEYIKVRHCRVCGSDNISDSIVNKNYYLINLNQTIHLSYVACQECQFIFQGEYVGDKYLENYYKSSPMLRRKKPTKFETDQNKRQASFVTQHLDIHGLTVLEIGAHAGAFLMYLNKKYQCKTYFDEMSEEAINVLSSQEGLIDYKGSATITKIDLVVLRHVLEHIFDLNSFINHIKSILKDDGCLFVEVPDWSWLDRKTDPLIFEHLNQFSTYNLIYLMKLLGWQCEAVEKSIVANDPATPNRVQRLLFKPTKVPVLFSNKIASTVKDFYQEKYSKGNVALDNFISRLDSDTKIALYPASHLTFSALSESRLREVNIIGMFDIDTKKHGKIVNGIRVYKASKLKEVMPDVILIFTMAYEQEIRDSFHEMGLTSQVVSITQLINGNV